MRMYLNPQLLIVMHRGWSHVNNKTASFFFPICTCQVSSQSFFFPKTDWKLTGCVTREFLRVLEFYGWSPLALHSRHLLDCPLAPVHSGVASPRVKGLAHAANQPELRCMVKITIGA